ncbi:MAG: NADH-quinone oxidoreductase subunit L, partial [Acidobacteria bacterium]|nr:NADH-quinone oxidoreductase subunit L [Acidobacteriota bacterium]
MFDTLAFAAEASSAVTSAGGLFIRNAWIIPVIPFVAFWLILFFGKKMPKGGAEIGIASVGIAFVLALCVGVNWIDHRDNFSLEADHAVVAEQDAELSAEGHEGEETHEADAVASDEADTSQEQGSAEDTAAGHVEAHPTVAVGNSVPWLQSGGEVFSVGFLIDGLAAMMLIVVTLISLLVLVYSTDYVSGDRRYTHYFAFLSLFTASMLFLVIAENTLQLIVAWELVGVCSFVLIGHWWEEKPNSDAALKAFLTNRVGDIGLLVGVSVLFFAAGNTFNIAEINTRALSGEISHTALLVASLCLLAAVMSKSGQFVLHTWLPDAMAGPTPVSALIHAATMVVAGVYMVARLYGVFWDGFSIGGSSINPLAMVGAITLLFGGALAFVQRDIKKVLAYSTVSQLGYMVLALGVGAWTAAVFHLFTHAFFKAGLFLGAGSVSHSVHGFDMKSDMGGLRKFMPKTFVTFLICSFALMGLPPLAGFWSKDEIFVGTGGWGLFGGTGGSGSYTLMLVMGMAGAALTAAYMTRVIYLTFFGEFRGRGEPHESGPRITVPLMILSFCGVVVGWLNLPVRMQVVPDGWTERFGHFVEPVAAYFPSSEVGFSHGEPSWSLAVASTLAALAGLGVAFAYYFVKVEQRSTAEHTSLTELADGPTSRSGVAAAGYTVLINKYYLDHLYTDIIVGGTKGPVADGVKWFDKEVLDGTVDGVGRGAVAAGSVVYNTIDQGVIDGIVDMAGLASTAGGD